MLSMLRIRSMPNVRHSYRTPHWLVSRTKRPRATFELGRRIGRTLRPGAVIALSGPLGAGKTVFAKGIAAGAGVADTARVSSPSFTLVNIYEGRYRIFHIDLYRLDREQDILDLGWEDMIGEGIVLVEWAEKLPFPMKGTTVKIETAGDDERRITIEN